MATFNSQILYGFTNGSKPLTIKVDDEEHKAVGFDDFSMAMRQSEEALGQKIIQDNSEASRLGSLVSDQQLSTLDSGTATAGQCASEINKMYNILTNLVAASKNS